MRANAVILSAFVFSITSANASEFPVADAPSAIAIAKKICRDPANSPVKWDANLSVDKRLWTATTNPSICPKLTSHLWIVIIPVDGPEPTECEDALYELICGPPQKEK